MENSRSNKMKPIFAAYLNMARQNAYVTLVHISKLMGIDEKRSEGHLAEFTIVTDLNTENKAERVIKLKRLFHKHFPFLTPMIFQELCSRNKMKKNERTYSSQIEQQNVESQVEVADTRLYYDILTSTLNLLSDLRNEYTHYLPDINQDVRHARYQIVSPHLIECLKGSFRVITERYFSTDKSTCFKEPEKEEKKDFITYGKQQLDALLDATELNSGIYRLITKRGDFTDVGILFFISLFIHKKYETMLIDSVQLFDKETTEVEKKIIREAFSVYRIRLPKERMESQRSGYALGMDMLNELQKCPKELFNILPLDKQSIFRVNRIKEMETENGSEQTMNEALLVRSADRFPYFALQYIDEMQLFNRLRFQVSLGKFRFAFYPKNCIDVKKKNTNSNDKRIRSLQKEINGFGRLDEIEQERRNKYGELLLTEEFKYEKMKEAEQKGLRLEEVLTEPYITDQYARYVVNGNRVGLKMMSGDKGGEKLFYLPELLTKTVNGKIRADSECLKPDCWLSIYELPALIFHHILCKDGDSSRTEKIIIDYLQAIKNFFSDVCKQKIDKESIFPKGTWHSDDIYEYNKVGEEGKLTEHARETLESYIKEKYHITIPVNALPQKMIQYLAGIKLDNENNRFRKMAMNRVKTMLEKTKNRLEMFKKERQRLFSEWNKVGDKGYIDIRAGKLANYLTADIVRFQPFTPEQNNKMTGLNYQVLQSTLALYQCTLSELSELFVRAKLLNQPSPNMNHPFLQQVLFEKPMSISAFYQVYLEKKSTYLEKILKQIENNQSYDKSFLHPDRVRWAARNEQFYLDLAKRYLGGSIELPRGLFEPKIKEILRKKYANEEKTETYVKEISDALNQTDKWCNVTHLIALYFRYHLKDSSQPFYKTGDEYGFTRTYTYFNMLLNERNEKGELPQSFHTLEEMNEWTHKNKQGVVNMEKWAEKYLNKISVTEKGKPNKRFKNLKATPNINKIDIEKRKLHKYRHEYQENEKVLRRYMVQDMLTFLIAKELLLNKMGNQMGIADKTGRFELNEKQRENIQKCKLEAFLPSSKDEGVLSLTLPFYLKLKVNTKEGKKEKIIYQEELKLKNCGDFFQFVYDDRVRTLLPHVNSDFIERQLLDKELEVYDRHRPTVFELIQTVEKVIVELHPDIKDANSEKYLYDARTDKAGNVTLRLPVKTNFKAMLRMQLGEADNREDISSIIEIRNAFSHNRYVEHLTLPEQTFLPELADYLVNYLNEKLRSTKLSKNFLKKK